MSYKEKIQSDRLSAMKSGNKELATLLGSVIGEMDRIGKTPTDDESIRIIKKMIESSKECNKFDDAKILDIYMPKQLSEQELENIIMSYIETNDYLCRKINMGDVMKYLKDTYGSTYDGKSASQIVRKVLS